MSGSMILCTTRMPSRKTWKPCTAAEAPLPAVLLLLALAAASAAAESEVLAGTAGIVVTVTILQRLP